jgi:hypothetical protein
MRLLPADMIGPRRDWRPAIFWIVILIGAVLRLAALGIVPGGLNSDEASSGVEALSVLHTGMDIWGNRLPVWFPAWGSGMGSDSNLMESDIVWRWFHKRNQRHAGFSIIDPGAARFDRGEHRS